MKKLWNDRRFITSIFAISCLTILGYTKNLDVSIAISGVALGIAAANASEGIFKKEKKDE